MPECPCGSGLTRRELKDAAGIFCCYVCDVCVEAKRAGFDQAIFNLESMYAITGDEADIHTSHSFGMELSELEQASHDFEVIVAAPLDVAMRIAVGCSIDPSGCECSLEVAMRVITGGYSAETRDKVAETYGWPKGEVEWPSRRDKKEAGGYR